MKTKNTDLGKGSIGKLLFRLACPAIIAQLVNVLYNIVDRIYLGKLPNGDMAMAGVGVAFPIIIMISAFAALIGYGGAPLCAIKMGEKDNEGAEKILSNSFSSLIIIGILLTILFSIFKENILWAFGASESTIGIALDYISIYLIGTICVQIALGMNSFINTQGFAKTGMITVLIGAVINIALDPVFIFGLNMGVKGAALATILAQTISAIWVLKFLFGKSSIVKIRRKFLMPQKKILLPILGLGISPFIMQATESLVLLSLNTQLQRYGGDIAVSTMTVMSSIMQMITLPTQGLSQGAQPIISYNYGAKNIDRVKQAFKLLFISCIGFTIIICSLLMAFPQFFVGIFNKSPELMKMAVWSIRIYFLGITIFGAQMACQQTFLALGQAKISLFIAMLRKIILLIPLIFILPNFFENKLLGVLCAEPISDILSVLTTIVCFSIFYKRTLTSESYSAKKKNIS